jgi:hypothetical protein
MILRNHKKPYVDSELNYILFMRASTCFARGEHDKSLYMCLWFIRYRRMF